jgi:hypothetical protein
MPTSRGRRRGSGSPTPSTSQSSHPSQTATEKKARYNIWRLLVGSLHALLGWLSAKTPSILTWMSVLIGIAAGALFFLPRVSVEPSAPYDPTNPSPVTFTIANINIVPLRNVHAFIGVCDIAVVGQREMQRCNGPIISLMSPPDPKWFVRWLDLDEKWQIALEDMFPGLGPKQIESADITIAVTYWPWWTFWHNTRQFASSPRNEVTAKSTGFRLRSLDRRREPQCQGIGSQRIPSGPSLCARIAAKSFSQRSTH